ncbi:MAG: hypothetical protein A2908_01795 [Candidatus Staskawiczbacteria bacterium RIFCSPLOWO2_01_FULL_38_12b]|uniref:Type II secretion system protein GspG C-terminal domain-containing protein n=1 Tax=Candidatus Staskawiczbacteria bacterium RIFCSPLOWO2_01_FULL_38_12b TaxID=1802214 RepID=A0A1G2IF26_9BACT|nr:MAG: hypothetical protein A2908_01795 [Candidatus Staskawiczbacteria bacterium RIFCSPLOWO2_01_FULL_38_12b]QBM02590.1 hypothetical protein [uncultured archaeon]
MQKIINSSRNKKGFTIIELLVVVAIIAVLTGIVLVNVTQYIGKSKNANIKGNMSTILTNAAVYYDDANPSTYVDFVLTASYTNPADAADAASGGTVTYSEIASAFCACSTMNTTSSEPAGSTFCVDTTGYKKVTVATCADRCVTADVGVCTDG